MRSNPLPSKETLHQRQDNPVTSERKIWIPACVGIGSNLDNPVAQVRQAIAALEKIDATRLIAASSLYRNPPMGPIEQPDYINAAATLLTRLAPRDLLARLQDLERRQGREQKSRQRWGPRRLDLDILTYGHRTISEQTLQIPHPGISERNFVLLPLLEIVPQLHIPNLGLVRKLVLGVDASTLEKIP
jgi:2-amino-4-hydroxy-6-hydroxymethyldihydropteridine diphosphokinase